MLFRLLNSCYSLTVLYSIQLESSTSCLKKSNYAQRVLPKLEITKYYHSIVYCRHERKTQQDTIGYIIVVQSACPIQSRVAMIYNVYRVRHYVRLTSQYWGLKWGMQSYSGDERAQLLDDSAEHDFQIWDRCSIHKSENDLAQRPVRERPSVSL